ncbi:hypothetical protein LWC34_23565 [Kibdelosporangium philippinense]|uniref:Lipoprotein n=1 Tax=Kibdelosporangium philippinense TaxID=211113 RepID=A0ABS8ZD52_9PSEU|nr:hypothetical protein [Kibdelosporangium philippinense]MCE7005783.1 hypothetical protein [Kibdelosporangium philippinense]
MRVTRLALATKVVVTAVLVAGCGQAVTGSPLANPADAKAAGQRLYNASVDAVKKYIKDATDFRGTVYRYGVIKDKRSGSEVNVSMRGTPPALITKIKSTSHPGFDYDLFRPADGDRQYIRLGPGYAKLAPTSWVSELARPVSGFSCAIAGLQTLCKLLDAMDQTAKGNPSDPQSVGLDDGATELRTGISLKAFIDNSVIPIPSDITATVDAQTMGRIFPTKIVVNADGTLRKVEVKGEAPGKDGKIQLEVGYEARGRSASDDFPPLPAADQTTALADEAASNDFWARLGAIRG